jgi:AcrR family transcriptional regulator
LNARSEKKGATRHHRKFSQQKVSLLSIASELFAAQGYSSVTMRRIAEAASCAPAALYTYFDDKFDIFTYLCEETFTGLEAALDAAEKDGLSGEENLLACSRAFCDFCLAHPHHFKVFLMASTDFGDVRAFDLVGQRGMASFRRLGRIYDAAGFPVEQPYGSFIWWNALKGIVDFIHLHRRDACFDGDRLLALSLDTMLEGHKRARRQLPPDQPLV